MKYFKVFIFLLLQIICLYGNEPVSKITISAIGDIMAHIDMQNYAFSQDKGFLSIYNEMVPLFMNDDLTIGNLETPVSDNIMPEGYPTFNAPVSFVSALKESGVDLVSTANNHSIDQGGAGITDTIDALNNAGVMFSGTGNNREDSFNFIYFNRGGIRIAYISVTSLSNIPQPSDPALPTFNYLRYWVDADKELLYQKLSEAKAYSDLVIVAVHDGEEYNNTPTRATERFYYELAEKGADVILGHHPHVVQRIELRNNQNGRRTLIAFSLGNFISAQSHFAGYVLGQGNESRLAKTSDGIVLRFDVIKINGITTVADPCVVPFYNVCFKTTDNPINGTGFRLSYINDILDPASSNNPYYTHNYNSLIELVRYRYARIVDIVKVRTTNLSGELANNSNNLLYGGNR